MRFGLTPYRQNRPARTGDPLTSLRSEMDEVWDSFFNIPPPPPFGTLDFAPSIDLTEGKKEIILRADLPGIDEERIDLEIDHDVLRLSGEREEEKVEDGEDRRIVERSYGRFERAMRLPFVPGEKDVKTEFRKGVLTVRIAKPKDGSGNSRKIRIASGD